MILQLHFRAEDVFVQISDNGQGFSLPNTMRSALSVGHMGLIGMRERATMLGGTIDIKTRSGAGTTISLIFPTISLTMTDTSENNQRKSENTNQIGGKDHGNHPSTFSR